MAIKRSSTSCPKAFISKSIPINYLPTKNGNLPFLYFGKTLKVKVRELMLALGFGEENVTKNMTKILNKKSIKTEMTGYGRNAGRWIGKEEAVKLATVTFRDTAFVESIFKEARARFPYSSELVYGKDSTSIPLAAVATISMTTLASYARKAGLKLTHSELTKHGMAVAKLSTSKGKPPVKVPTGRKKFTMENAYEPEILEEYFEAVTASAAAAGVSA